MEVWFYSPFKADIYFVSLKQITSLRWGTASPFFVNDADMGSIETRANGSYFMKVGDPKKFFTEYSGTREI